MTRERLSEKERERIRKLQDIVVKKFVTEGHDPAFPEFDAVHRVKVTVFKDRAISFSYENGESIYLYPEQVEELRKALK